MAYSLIIAGAGYTGSRLARRLKNHRPLCLVSSRASADALEAYGIDVQVLDLDRIESGSFDIDPAADVVYLVPPGPPETDGDGRLAGFLAALGGARRVVYISTTGVYGDRGGTTVTEDDPPAPGTGRARRRVAAEAVVRDWCAANGSDWIVLRVPGIYGPGRLQQRLLASGKPVLRREDAPPGNRVHVDDLVTAIEAALAAPNAGRVYNVGDGEYAPQAAFLDIVAELTGLPAPVEVSLAKAEATFDEGRLSFLRERRRVDTARIRNELDWRPTYPGMRAGIRASLVENGQLMI